MFRLRLTKKFSPQGQSGSGMGCQERLCSLHPWELSRLDKAWRNLVWAQNWPCFEREVGLETSCGHLQPGFSYGPGKKLMN